MIINLTEIKSIKTLGNIQLNKQEDILMSPKNIKYNDQVIALFENDKFNYIPGFMRQNNEYHKTPTVTFKLKDETVVIHLNKLFTDKAPNLNSFMHHFESTLATSINLLLKGVVDITGNDIEKESLQLFIPLVSSIDLNTFCNQILTNVNNTYK